MIKKQYVLLAFLYLMVAAGCGNQESKTDLGESDVTFKVFVDKKEIQPIKGKYHVKVGQNVHIELEYTGRYKQYWHARFSDKPGQGEQTDEYGKAKVVIGKVPNEKRSIKIPIFMELHAPIALSTKEKSEIGEKILYIPLCIE